MSKRVCNVCSLIINLTIFIVSAFSVAHGFRTDIIREEVEWFSFVGLQNLRYYTTLSNVFCALTAVVTLFFNVRNVVRDEYRFPTAITLLKYSSTVSIALTFLTVALFLSPMVALSGNGYFTLFLGNSFFMHFLTPVLAITEFLLFERANFLRFKYTFFAVIPAAIYSVVYFSCVLLFKVWPDFYNFTLGGNYGAVPLVVSGMYALTYVISLLIFLLHKKTFGKGFSEDKA
ncbi:MAG: hypothetical protein IJQ66_03020 [Clostridia bacterium]|nr:hypothetical protein [Clostridia bacterium]